MSLHVLSNRLARWDETERDALVLTFFADERPLRGAAGLADWRLCGQLSQLIRHRKISGAQGETLMLPPGRRLPFSRILLFGLGDSRDFDEVGYRAAVRWIHDVVRRAGIACYAVQAPGRATGIIGARRALELWLEETGADEISPESDVAVIDNPEAHKDMAELLRYRGKR